MVLFKKILVAIDFQSSSDRALAAAIALAEPDAAEVILLHVWEVAMLGYSSAMYSGRDVLAPIRAEAQRALDVRIARARLRARNVSGMLRAGDPWQEILDAAEELHPELVVLGTHGRGLLGRALLGSVAAKTVRTAPVPVLTVRG